MILKSRYINVTNRENLMESLIDEWNLIRKHKGTVKFGIKFTIPMLPLATYNGDFDSANIKKLLEFIHKAKNGEQVNGFFIDYEGIEVNLVESRAIKELLKTKMGTMKPSV